jgi:pimeloyl-ACP methyl ester carboxylesterase
MWRPLIVKLAKTRTVIAPDLRGFGQSAKPSGGYDKKSMARDIHVLAVALGFKTFGLAGHDIGLMVAYALAAQYPAEIERIALMDAFLPGVGEWNNVFLLRDIWHFHFFGETPLKLVKGRERIYFEHSGMALPPTPRSQCRRQTADFTQRPTPGPVRWRRGLRCSGRLCRTPRISQRWRKPS